MTPRVLAQSGKKLATVEQTASKTTVLDDGAKELGEHLDEAAEQIGKTLDDVAEEVGEHLDEIESVVDDVPGPTSPSKPVPEPGIPEGGGRGPIQNPGKIIDNPATKKIPTGGTEKGRMVARTVGFA